MALSKNIKINFKGKELEFQSAYLKITNVSGDKNKLCILVTIYSDNQCKDEISYNYYDFVPNVEETAKNFIEQGYEYLKTLDEYKDVVDC